MIRGLYVTQMVLFFLLCEEDLRKESVPLYLLLCLLGCGAFWFFLLRMKDALPSVLWNFRLFTAGLMAVFCAVFTIKGLTGAADTGALIWVSLLLEMNECLSVIMAAMVMTGGCAVLKKWTDPSHTTVPFLPFLGLSLLLCRTGGIWT